MGGVWKYVGMAVGILVGIDFCRRGEWWWGIGSIVCVVLWVLAEAWSRASDEEEAKEERAEERRERLANEREMKRMELEHQSRKPDAALPLLMPKPPQRQEGDG